MAIYSSILAWKIPWTEEPGRLQSMGSHSRTRLKQLGTAHTTQIKLAHKVICVKCLEEGLGYNKRYVSIGRRNHNGREI